MESLVSSVNVIRQQGAFGPNRWRQVSFTFDGKEQVFDLSLVGSGACIVHASVDKEGNLCRPQRWSAWTIRISATGGGKVTEMLDGQHARKGFEASTTRHRGFMLARMLFAQVWAQSFGTTLLGAAQEVIGGLDEAPVTLAPKKAPPTVEEIERRRAAGEKQVADFEQRRAAAEKAAAQRRRARFDGALDPDPDLGVLSSTIQRRQLERRHRQQERGLFIVVVMEVGTTSMTEAFIKAGLLEGRL